jgi:hypothetical protein
MAHYIVRFSGPYAAYNNNGGVSFDAPDGTSAARLQELARDAIYARSRGSSDFGNIPYDLYLDNGDGTFSAADTRLGLNGAGDTVGTWNAVNGTNRFNNPFPAARVVPREGAHDTVTGAVTGLDGAALPASLHLPPALVTQLNQITFESNGREGMQREEALSYLREFEKVFRGRTFTIEGREVRGEDLLRDVVASGRANMGILEGNRSLTEVYRTARLDYTQAASRTDADFARFIENPGLSTDPGAAAPDPSITDFLANPTPANAARLRADKARTDELINALMAALASGNTDVLTTVMDLVARNGRGTVAQLAMNAVRRLQEIDASIARVNTRIEGLDLGAADANARARATGQFQQANVELAALNSTRQSIIQMLETALRAMEEENRTAQRVSEAYARAHMAGVR